jgi:hypothetical protein
MRINNAIHKDEVASLFQKLFEIAPYGLWRRRLSELDNKEKQNPFLSSFFDSRYSIERTFQYAYRYYRATGRYPDVTIGGERIFDLYSFAAGIVRVYEQLTEIGRARLRGCLRDGLTDDKGLAPLALEMGAAIHLSVAGFDVEFVDMEERGRFDLLASKDGLEIEIECKTASGDVGRRIHRHRALDLFHRLAPAMSARLDVAHGEAFQVVLPDRLHGAEEIFNNIVAAANDAIKNGTNVGLDGVVRITVEKFDVSEGPFLQPQAPTQMELQQFVDRKFGQQFGTAMSIHRPHEAAIIVALKSEQSDKVVEGVYRALKHSAKKQFTRTKPASLIVRLTDLADTDLRQLATEPVNGLAAIATRLQRSEDRQHMISVGFVAPTGVLTPNDLGAGATVLRGNGMVLGFQNPNHPLAADPRTKIWI